MRGGDSQERSVDAVFPGVRTRGTRPVHPTRSLDACRLNHREPRSHQIAPEGSLRRQTRGSHESIALTQTPDSNDLGLNALGWSADFLRQLDVTIVLSRMTRPDAWMVPDSMSSLLVPVLPMCG